MHSINLKKKKKLSQDLSHGQFGPSNAVVITGIINYYHLTYLLIFFMTSSS